MILYEADSMYFMILFAREFHCKDNHAEKREAVDLEPDANNELPVPVEYKPNQLQVVHY